MLGKAAMLVRMSVGRASVEAVALSAAHTFSKRLMPEICLVAGFGVEGDVHAGAKVRHRYQVRRNPHAPNLCQVHLLHEELFAELAGQGIEVEAGAMGENVTAEFAVGYAAYPGRRGRRRAYRPAPAVRVDEQAGARVNAGLPWP